MFAKPLCAADPFDLLLTPDVVVQAMERSERLGQLRRRICRPLDTRVGELEASPAGEPQTVERREPQPRATFW
jgi:hypothetical protein